MSRLLLELYESTSEPRPYPRSAPVFAPGPAPPPSQGGLTTEVLIAIAVASFLLVAMFVGIARFLILHLTTFDARATERAAAEAAAEEAASDEKEAGGARKHLQRVTPVIVIQPDQEILYGLKDRPTAGEGCPEVHISVDSSAPPQHPLQAPKTPKDAYKVKTFYVVDIPDLSEPSCPTDIDAGEVLKKIQVAKEHVRAYVCRDSVSSCQA